MNVRDTFCLRCRANLIEMWVKFCNMNFLTAKIDVTTNKYKIICICNTRIPSTKQKNAECTKKYLMRGTCLFIYFKKENFMAAFCGKGSTVTLLHSRHYEDTIDF